MEKHRHNNIYETITEKLMKVVGGEWFELNKKYKKWGKYKTV